MFSDGGCDEHLVWPARLAIVHKHTMGSLFLSLLGALRSAFRTHADLVVENLALRQQLANFRRTSSHFGLARAAGGIPGEGSSDLDASRGPRVNSLNVFVCRSRVRQNPKMSWLAAGRCISAHREMCSGKQAGHSARDVAKGDPLLLQPHTTTEAVKAEILEDRVLFLSQT